MSRKTAVVLFNLGGPDKPESISPFLKNFFMDKNIIAAPFPVRFLVSRLIAYKRSRKEAGASYGLLGGKSPLLENTLAQAESLQKVLGEDFKVFVSMRYWHPMAADVVRQVKAYEPDDIVLLPLYPQYSTTTTRSSLEDWQKQAQRQGLSPKRSPKSCVIGCYPFQDGFIAASADLVKQAFDAFVAKHGTRPRVLFSAHGLPEKIVDQGDPYQWECEQGAARIAAATGIDHLDWMSCYQSRVGPLKWIGPSTEDALKKAAADKVPVLIYPHAFVSEHVETLVEIEQEYRHMAHEFGVPAFERVPTVSCHPAFITGLADLVRNALSENAKESRICPIDRAQCCRTDIDKIFGN